MKSTDKDKLKELFPRLTAAKSGNSLPAHYSAFDCGMAVIEGPRGYITLSPDSEALDVVVDIKDGHARRSVASIVRDPYLSLAKDGEYCFRIAFSDTFNAALLIGLKPGRHG